MKWATFLVISTLFGSFAANAQDQSAQDSSANSETTGTMDRAGSAASSAIRQTREGFADAAMSPLEDLNLRRDEIPPLLLEIQSPYEMPREYDCYEISTMVYRLDPVLGPDWDAPNEEKREWNEQAADGMAGAALDTVSSEASGIIPFRSVVRKVTRAEQHARAYNLAFAKGRQRRAFLKGLGQARNCGGNAAPRPIEIDSKIKYRAARTTTESTVRRRVVRKPSTPNGN